MSIKKQIRTAGDTAARHGHTIVLNLQRVMDPRVLMHFEQGKNGRVQGYRAFEALAIYPQAGQARSKSPIVYVAMSTDNKFNAQRGESWDINNPVGDSNPAVFGLSQLAPEKYREVFELNGNERYPFNSWEVHGQLSEDYIPTRKFEQAGHINAMRGVSELFQKAASLDQNDPVGASLLTQAFAMQKQHFEELMASGQIEISGLIYANQNGLRPSATIYQDQQGTGIVGQKLFMQPRFKMTFVPFTNVFTGYVSADMSMQSDPELLDGQGNDILYGIHTVGAGKRTGIRQEATVYDGQGNAVRSKLSLVNAMPQGSDGFVDRAATLQKVLSETTPNLVLVGNATVRFNKRNNDPSSEAVVFSINIDEYIAVPVTANVPKRTTVSTDDLDIGDISFNGSAIVEDQHLEAPSKKDSVVPTSDDEFLEPTF